MHQHGGGRPREEHPVGTGLPVPAPHRRPPDVRALQRLAGNAAVARAVGRGPGTRAPVQRTLVVGQTNFTDHYRRRTRQLEEDQHSTVVDDLSGQAHAFLKKAVDKDLSPEERERFMNQEGPIVDQLKKAIVSPVGHKGYHPALKRDVGAHPDFGAKNHKILVNDYAELARHLMGWVAAKGNRKKEKEMAQAIQDEGEVEVFLDVLLKRLYLHFEDKKNERRGQGRFTEENEQKMVRELTRTLPGTYATYFGGDKFKGTRLRPALLGNGGYLAVMRNPEKFGFRDKLITLHDLQEYFGRADRGEPTQGTDWLPGTSRQELQSTAGFDAEGKRRTTSDRGNTTLRRPPVGVSARQPSVRNEDSETTKLARAKNMPVWAGQSFRAARMMKMAQTAGASQEEIAAVAWGVFSFWRVHYDHTSTLAYHTLHEVMDIAQNFGVPYDMDAPYEGGSMPSGRRLRQRFVALADELTTAHQEADAEIKAIESDPGRADHPEAAEFLAVATSARRQLDALRSMVQERADAFAGWEEGTLDSQGKRRLVEESLRSLQIVKAHVEMLSDAMAKRRPR
ncbi:hypothetical protein SUDANB145_04103 [Streptomyces sp. enrichment culture]|uniref:hypothetical protein n=1 Tax=Streptomyces sp. enrichment culture TaxID=1795815 RepID=UPI003F5626E3